jgi:DNA modification methylase
MNYQRKETIGDATLYLANSIELLPSLGECADLVVTDPPYKLESGGNTTGEMKGKFAVGTYDNSGSIVACDIDWPDFMPLLFDALRGDAHAYVMANNRHVQAMLNAADDSGFRFHNLLVWDKGNATPNRWFMKNCEFTGFFFKGKAKYVNDCGAKQLLYVPQEPYGNHPTPKPVMLMRHYIEQSSKPGQVVLDPFMGVGSTGVAALRSGRKFIGVELDESFFDLACRRIENEISEAKSRELMLI